MESKPLSEIMSGPLKGVLAEIEAVRRQEDEQNKKFNFAVAAALGVACLLLLVAGSHAIGYILAVGAAAVVVLMKRSRSASNIGWQFRRQAVPFLLEGIHTGLNYDPFDGIGEGEFHGSGLFISPDRYDCRDLVTGVVGETDIRFSFVHAEEEYEETVYDTETDSDGNTHTVTRTETRWRDIFKGLFFSADFHKDFTGFTRVVPGGTNFLTRLSSTHVLLEDVDFNRRFSVYSSDQVEARYILTPNMMERILAVDAKFSGKMRIAFTDSRVIMAIDMALDALSPDLRYPLDSTEAVSGVYSLLHTVVGMVDDLNLNTRIWTKGSKPGWRDNSAMY
jgi:hypothetical protein